MTLYHLQKLGGALDHLKGSFEGAFGDDIKSYLENITEWIEIEFIQEIE